MSDELHVAKGFALPRAIAARTVFVTGTKGSGKTHNAGVIAEELLASGVHVVILDPLGVWWGLRHDAAGGAGGFPIVILGGGHADAPLLPTAGEAVAEYLVRSGQSTILDLSGFSANAEQDRFVTDLLHRLFRLKATEKSNLHLVIDEADLFIPQQAISKTEIPLLGAAKTIVTKGRSRGLSMTMITQRPQSIAKAAIEEADVVLCHRMQGVNAVKAMKSWTDLYASKEQAETFFDSLPGLADGECWVWSPHFLKTFERAKFRLKKTFDSSKTPDPGEIARKPKAAAAVDLDKLTAEIRATAEQARANDPRELKRQIAELRQALAAKPAAAAAPPAPKEKRVEVPVIADAQLARLETLYERAEARTTKAMEALAGVVNPLSELLHGERAEIGKLIAAARAVKAGPPPLPTTTSPRAVLAAPRRDPPPPAARAPRAAAAENGSTLPDGERKVLTAAAQHDGGVDREQLTVLTGYKRSSRDSYIQRLRARGYLDAMGDALVATPEGLAALGPSFERLPTGDALRDYWVGRLPEGERRILEVLIPAYPDAVERDAVGEATGYKRSSRDSYLQRLGARKLVESVGRGEVRASSTLFG